MTDVQDGQGMIAGSGDGAPELAVVVLAVGAPRELGEAVASLLRQPVPLEIVLVNSGGGDPHAVLPEGSEDVNVISVPQRLWPGAARNLGVKASRAPWIAFLASDHIAREDWAVNRLKLHKEGRKSVASAVVNSHPRNIFAWASHVAILVRRLPKVPRRAALRYGVSYARELFERYGAFREDLRIGEDTEFNRRMDRPDRPVWAPKVQVIHRNPTTFRAMVDDQFKRGRRTGLHWPSSLDEPFTHRVFRRFMLSAPLSFRSVRGLERAIVVASWPLVLVCCWHYERGATQGHRERLAKFPDGADTLPERAARPARVVVVAILDRDDWTENTDIIVVADATARRLTWVPRDLWSPLLKDRVNTAFAVGGGDLLLSALAGLGFRADGVVCLRRAASEAALSDVDVTVPVLEPLDFWYPLHPTRLLQEGKKAVSFRPPEERLCGERVHQWIGARTEIRRIGSDLYRLKRQQVLLRALLDSGFDFRTAIADPELVRKTGADPMAVLAQVRSDWDMVVFDAVENAMIDGKGVLVPRRPAPRSRRTQSKDARATFKRLRQAVDMRINPKRNSLFLNRRKFEKWPGKYGHLFVGGNLVGERSAPPVDVTVDSELPRLAWRGTFREGRMSFVLGPGVERFGNGFYEGVWAGPFIDPRTAADSHAFGSGALIEDGSLTILLPKHTFEACYMLRAVETGEWHIANSLCHCLAAGGLNAGSEFFETLSASLHKRAHAQTRAGVCRYNPLLAATQSHELFALYYCNFRILADGSISFCQPYLGRKYKDFQDYRGFLVQTLSALVDNAASSARAAVLTPATTVSKGYDSPAVAVLAREAGCREALCMEVAVGGVDDTGSGLASALGFNVHTHGHPLGRDISDLKLRYGGYEDGKELEFVATAGIGDDLSFAGFEPSLPDTMLCTGAWGDSIWQRQSNVAAGVPVRILFGKSLTEFRLRVGFAHVPVPVIGAFFPRSITSISASPEMSAYSIGGSYDRPIPRRIVEEAGIERGAFAAQKVATNPHPTNHRELWADAMADTMSRYRIRL